MIAEEMTHLSGEIAALHSKRTVMMGDLARGSKDLTASVRDFCAGLAAARNGMAKQSRSDRMAFLKDLKSNVNELRRGVAMDLDEVRRVWTGRNS